MNSDEERREWNKTLNPIANMIPKDVLELNAFELAYFAVLVKDVMKCSPDYLLEKFRRCQRLKSPFEGLDGSNRELLAQWAEKWANEAR